MTLPYGFWWAKESCVRFPSLSRQSEVVFSTSSKGVFLFCFLPTHPYFPPRPRLFFLSRKLTLVVGVLVSFYSSPCFSRSNRFLLFAALIFARVPYSPILPDSPPARFRRQDFFPNPCFISISFLDPLFLGQQASPNHCLFVLSGFQTTLPFYCLARPLKIVRPLSFQRISFPVSPLLFSTITSRLHLPLAPE